MGTAAKEMLNNLLLEDSILESASSNTSFLQYFDHFVKTLKLFITQKTLEGLTIKYGQFEYQLDVSLSIVCVALSNKVLKQKVVSQGKEILYVLKVIPSIKDLSFKDGLTRKVEFLRDNLEIS